MSQPVRVILVVVGIAVTFLQLFTGGLYPGLWSGLFLPMPASQTEELTGNFLLEPVHAFLLDHTGKTWNARIPCPSELESASRPGVSFPPSCVFLR